MQTLGGHKLKAILEKQEKALSNAVDILFEYDIIKALVASEFNYIKHKPVGGSNEHRNERAKD